MADIDIREQMKKDLDECPEWIVSKSIEVIQKIFQKEVLSGIREQIEKVGDDWWIPYHFHTGMSVRNLLRDKVCLDGEIPSGNWDDYYVQVLEMAVLEKQ